MALITARRLINGDPARGNGLSNFVVDIDAIAQTVTTTLLLFTGEWFEALALGTPAFQSILGVPNTEEGIALILRQRILSVPFVTGVSNVVVTYTPSTRAYTFGANVQTVFGSLAVSNQPSPGNNAALTP